MRLGVVLAAFALILSGSAIAADKPTPKDVAKAEAEKAAAEKKAANLTKQAAQAARDAKALADKLVAAAAEERRFEERAAEAEAKLADLTAKETAAKDGLYADRKALENVLAALMRFSRQKPPAMAAHETRAQDAVRAAILLGAIEPALEARARKLAVEIDALTSLRAEAAKEAEALASAEKSLDAKKTEIEALLAIKRGQQVKLSFEAERYAADAKRAAAKANTLRDLIAAVARKAGSVASGVFPDARSASGLRFSAYKGKVSAPAAGPVSARYGKLQASGEKAQGLTIQTRRRAQVSAPFDARIEFAGPWRSYGGLVILNVGEGYVIVLAGMSEVFGVPGQEVLAGEPLGEMADRRDPPPELYLELRREGVPVDPGPWLRSGV
jgi:septal ring factor EnvC (AmiA/AmiB activator)